MNKVVELKKYKMIIGEIKMDDLIIKMDEILEELREINNKLGDIEFNSRDIAEIGYKLDEIKGYGLHSTLTDIYKKLEKNDKKW